VENLHDIFVNEEDGHEIRPHLPKMPSSGTLDSWWFHTSSPERL